MMGGPGAMMGGMMNREVSAANIGLRIMASYLDLTEAQIGKIALIREEAQDAMRPQMSQRRGQRSANAEGEGGPPDFQAMMQEMQASMQKAERKATTDTTALLSEAQSSRLKLLVKALKGLQDSGIRPEAALKLQLSDSQLTKLAQGSKPESVLSSEQQTIAQSFQAPMGRGSFGGPGGPDGFPGGPPPGGFGGG